MLIDARTLPEGTRLEADLAIIGGGAAGIAIAREFIGRGLAVVLIEAGGLDYDDATQALYEGTTAGNPIADLDVGRLRYLGGTTNHWAGYCRPFDPLDFAVRPWVPNSGWPIGRDSLLPWYERAQPVLELGDFVYDPARWTEFMAPLFSGPLMEGRLRPAIFQQSPPTNLGTTYRGELEQAGDVRVLLWANVTDIRTDEAANRVSALDIACLDGPRFRVVPKETVLATGGIENARLLLLSNSTHAAGLGNAHDLVGRYFMDHPAYEAATILFASPTDEATPPAAQVIDTQCTLAPETEREEGLLRFLTTLHPVHGDAPPGRGYVAMRNLSKSLRRGLWPDDFWSDLGTVLGDLDGAVLDAYDRLFVRSPALSLRIHPEVAPNPDSRVTLGPERDALGLNRVHLDWRLTELDRRSMRRGLEIVGEEFGRTGLGRLRLEPWIEEDGFAVPGNGSYHHIGTTRMSDEPKHGVVDADCRVHGMDNLYLAGSSVFPTAGFANPTLTIVALALRLADHLKAKHA